LALAAIKNYRTVVEIAKQFELHSKQIIYFHQYAMESMVGLFTMEAAAKSTWADLKLLHAMIGVFALENNFLDGTRNKERLFSFKQ